MVLKFETNVSVFNLLSSGNIEIWMLDSINSEPRTRPLGLRTFFLKFYALTYNILVLFDSNLELLSYNIKL